ncbi:MAG TPA: creatininase family protein [Candidatus Ozemobacteraceae bacterium]|nr:creatininase family protein [Candidatus Ozemobacteraceae bacterium]
MNLNTLTHTEAETFDRDTTVVLVPCGSTEPHGPHLPLGTKAFIAEAVAFEIGQRLKASGRRYLVAPVFPYLPCQASMGLPGALTVSPRVASEMLYEIGAAFHRDGFRRLAFIHFSTSPEATKAVLTACDDLAQLDGMQACDPLGPFRFSPPETVAALLREAGTQPATELHGDIRETAAMLYLDPELVQAERARELPQRLVNLQWETLKGNFSWIERGAEDGYAGSPAAATPDLGQPFLEEAGKSGAAALQAMLDDGTVPPLPLPVRLLLKLIDLDDL